MDTVYPALYQKLAADATLSSLVQDIALGDNPDDPEYISAPLVTIHVFGGPDVNGLHGAAVEFQPEIKVWGYGNSMYKDCVLAAARVDLILLEGLTLPNGNFIGSFRPITGWQEISTADAKRIQLQNQYSARYWSADKISTITM